MTESPRGRNKLQPQLLMALSVLQPSGPTGLGAPTALGLPNQEPTCQSYEGLFLLCTDGDPITGNKLSTAEAPECAGLGLASWPDSMKRARDPHNTVGLAQKGLRWAGKDQPTPNKFQENPNTRFHVLNKFTCRLQYSKCNFFFKKRSLNSESVKSNEMWWYLSCTAVI